MGAGQVTRPAQLQSPDGKEPKKGWAHRITYPQAALGAVAGVAGLLGLASLLAGGQATPEGDGVTLVAGDDATARAAQDTKNEKAKLEADRAKKQVEEAAKTHSDSPRGTDTLDIYTAAKMNLLAGLKDPDSATVRNSFVSKLDNGGMALCGEVNSKNGFGGMTGFKRFIASASNPEATLIEGEIETGFGSATDANLFPAAYQQFCTHPVEQF